MPDTKKVLLILPHMVGGGAERVAALLMNSFAANGCRTEMVLTSDRKDEVVRHELDDNTELTLLPEILPKDSAIEKIKYGVLLKIIAQVFCNLFELFRLPVPADFAKASLYVQYHREIAWLRDKLRQEPDCAVIAFLQPAIPIALLASRRLPNNVIFSERGDPYRLMEKRYGRKFIEKYYRRADAAVFQTTYARDAFPAHIAEKGVVIPNPIRTGLPEPWHGERDKTVSTFCRISAQKNLPLLVEAFAGFRRECPHYRLRIIGDAPNEEGRAVMEALTRQIADLSLEDAVEFVPFRQDVHDLIRKDAMYVNSSDYEGISNAMLEAMAIGLPCVCTDCPVGGARATIRNRENGLLVPVGDPEAMSCAMQRLANDPALAETLSENAAALREELSLEKIAKRWMELLYNEKDGPC